MDLETLKVLHEKYETLKGSTKCDKLGTETEPGWECSPAKSILDEMLKIIDNCLKQTNQNGNHYFRLLAMQGTLYYQHAKILVQLNESEKAQDILKTCVEVLKDSILIPEITFLCLRVLNHYCYLLTKNGDLNNSQLLLEFAESKYLQLKSNCNNDVNGIPLYSNDDLFDEKLVLSPNKEINEKLERLVTNNLQMLGFVYNRQGNLDKFAMYHHRVLKRQLDMREGDATIWAMKTARLGYFFLTQNKFSQARHHLAAACYVLSQYENTLKTLEATNLVVSKWEELNHRYADIAKCWVKYGLFLFNASKMKLVSAFYGESTPFLESACTNPFDGFIYGRGNNVQNENEGESSRTTSEPKSPRDELHNGAGSTNLEACEPEPAQEEESTSEARNRNSHVFDVVFENWNPSDVSIGIVGADINRTASAPNEAEVIDKRNQNESKSSEAREPDFKFSNLDLSCFENCVSCNPVDSLRSARALFLFTHSWLKKSKLFYTLKDHPMEYVDVILDLSELYRYLAFYEDDIENRYLFQKRRADTLEALSAALKEARPQRHVALSVELLRELAEVHLELMGLNLRRLYLSQPSEPSEDSPSKSPRFFDDASNRAVQKMEAIADLRRRLRHFGDDSSRGASGDFRSDSAPSSVGRLMRC